MNTARTDDINAPLAADMDAPLAVDINAPLAARGLVVGYGGCALFPPLDLAVRAGDFVCLLGRNGAGKTTLLKTLAGVLPPLAGAVTLGGDGVAALSGRERARRAALLSTDVGLPPFLLGRELVQLGRTPHASWLAGGGEADEAAVRKAMEALHCGHLADRRVGRLSDGERQRLCLARVIAQDAPVLLLDEPLAHLDLPAKAELLALLRDWTRREGRVVIAAIHEIDLAMGFADACLMVAPGMPPFLGAPEAAAGEPLRRVFPGWPEFWDPLGLRKKRMGNVE